MRYFPNGGGRDSYIHLDNGGIYGRRKDWTIPHNGARNPLHQQNNVTDCNKAPARYYPDGTGRDGYSCLQTSKPFDFEANLRGHPAYPRGELDPGLKRTTPEGRAAVTTQAQSSSRLASPKGPVDPRSELTRRVPSDVRTTTPPVHISLQGTRSTFVTKSFSKSKGWM